jgi:cyclohexanone monooxygenase
MSPLASANDPSILPPPPARPAGRSLPRRIVVIGAGPGGIAAGIRLRQAGYDDVVILEQAPGLGGTWWHNRYPGAACDVKSFLYSFSFAPKADWTRAYSAQPEILAYLQDVVRRHDLDRAIRFDSPVMAADWDEASGTWLVETGRGETFTADVLIGAVGMFNEVRWPDLPGLWSFRGPVIHTARWRDDVMLHDRRVAVIGSAASAVQLVPTIAEQVRQLHVFQRSANWVLPKDDAAYDAATIAAHLADSERVRAARREVWDRVESIITFSDPKMLRGAAEAGRRALEAVRDPIVRRKLTPNALYGSHRPLISNDWYPTFNRPNVELVTEPIAKVTADGLLTADGQWRHVDAIICATGFHTTRFLSTIAVTGREGRTLAEAWRDGAHAYLGVATAGFPNLFMLYGPNTNNGSLIYMLECQVDYVLRLLRRMDDEHLARIEIRADAEAAYNAQLQRDLDAVEVWRAHATGYYRGPAGTIVTQWPHNMSAYRAATTVDDRGAWEPAPG